MSIEVLTADADGSENLQRWAAMGLPVPPSWRLDRDDVLSCSGEQLVQKLRALPRMFTGERYWVLQQGRMNPESQRESLLNLDSDEALAAALHSIFQRDNSPDQLVIQALPGQKAAGVLFTRHPLRQDLPHMVVEGVREGSEERQRLIYDDDGRLVHASQSHDALQDSLNQKQLQQLHDALRCHFDQPQAGEWVFDGEQLWLLQTLPVGSLPTPKEAWTRRAGVGLFTQAATPLWYTLAGRWLKNSFWEPMVAQQRWSELARVEPYRRQHSHVYANSAYFRQLQQQHPGATQFVPPAWQLPESTPALLRHPLSDAVSLLWLRGRLNLLSFKLKGWQMPAATREGLWRAFMQLDALGEQLSSIEGPLGYLQLPDRLAAVDMPLPLAWLTSRREFRLIQHLSRGEQAGQVSTRTLRPGADPVHAPLDEGPAQAANLAPAISPKALADSVGPHSQADLEPWLELARQGRSLRYALANRLRELLRAMAAIAVNQGLLQHPDDIYFLYFDELWQLWMGGQPPASASQATLAERKLRYLDDALQGAPDWKMDQVGYGFGGGRRVSPLLLGQTLVPGVVEGPIRRLCSAWGLNKICPGDIVVIDQVEPSWLPWLVQAGALVIAEKNPANAAASLAQELGIPAIWAARDVMHSVQNDCPARLIADEGRLEILEQEDGA